ncbi:MAG: DUF2797 domain-containing protein [Candidatus Shikimatogenerans bostrichidophilus]|nr:MAG: DUF2797 domain-containing protein [Candidatus Shikimatogenerans bostrichidophilus]
MGIFFPSKCTSHLNIKNKNLIKEKKIELQKHIVYISLTGNIKVGITIKKNFKIRLIDQGSIKAIKLAETPNRYISGLIENICKKKISDRTNFRRMLTNKFIKNINLKKIKNTLINLILKKSKIYKKYIINNNKIYKFIYPIIKYPKKIKILNLIKKKYIKNKKLIGIKGQYLIFKKNYVLNIRNHIGYSINIKF